MNSSVKRISLSFGVMFMSASVLIGSTFALQSINQEAENIVSDTVNPGGRLHNDFYGVFDGSAQSGNADVYVENFGDQPIFARVMIREYLEMGNEAGQLENETRDAVVMTYANSGAAVKSVYDKTDTWWTHCYEDQLNIYTSPYWDWHFGGNTIYMPTFNRNKDSLKPDINGTFGADFLDYQAYSIGDTLIGTVITDADTNSTDEYLQFITENGSPPANSTEAYTLTENVLHTAAQTDTASVISMEQWLSLPDEQRVGAYWVYDTDGWAYWAQPIPPESEGINTTGLLLDAIEPDLDDTYFYAIHVTAQFVTQDDLGTIQDGTGFYDLEKGSAPSENALTLLAAIGALTQSA